MYYVKYIRDRVGHDEINLTGVNVLIIYEELPDDIPNSYRILIGKYYNN